MIKEVKIYKIFFFLLFSAHFQNGTLTNTDKIIVKRVEEAETDKKYALVATPESVYKADISSPGSAYVNTFLAVRNKRTNEISLIQVQEASFMVRQQIRRYNKHTSSLFFLSTQSMTTSTQNSNKTS